jgi:hypothetical protein
MVLSSLVWFARSDQLALRVQVVLKGIDAKKDRGLAPHQASVHNSRYQVGLAGP